MKQFQKLLPCMEQFQKQFQIQMVISRQKILQISRQKILQCELPKSLLISVVCMN